MKKIFRVLIDFFAIIMLLAGITVTGLAHSGRTDGQGGHRDNRNVSGLGSYHYHCGGYPAHLHPAGYCPYTDVFPSSISIQLEQSTLRLGESCSISASVSPSNACSSNVSWESSDPSVVSVSNGEITALDFGTATITASTFNNKTASIRITVNEVVADSVEIIGFEGTEVGEENILNIGDSRTLSAKIYPEDVDNSTITWVSSTPEIVSVKDGKIEALSAGTAIITATSSNGKSDTLALTIQEVVANRIEIQVPETVVIGDQARLDVKFYPENTSSKEIEWKTSNEDIATVGADGKMKAKDVGTVTITAIQKDVEANVTIDIQPINVQRITFFAPTEFDGQFNTGDSVQLTATIFPENATYKNLTWSSSSQKVVTVDETGLLTAASSGTAVITAVSADGVEATVHVYVESQFIPAALIGISTLFILLLASVVAQFMKHKHADKIAGVTLSADMKRIRIKKLLILGGVAVLGIVIVTFFSFIFSLTCKYNRAIFLSDINKPAEAAVLFEELGGFKDSECQLEGLTKHNTTLNS